MSDLFVNAAPVFEQAPDEGCRVSVIVPARNEEELLPRALEALRLQVDADGCALDPACFEVLLLLNNCTDESFAVAKRYAREHVGFRLCVEHRQFAPQDAHVGTARRLLMDAACRRLEGLGTPGVILSTDADTVVAPDWIANNLRHFEAGAEVVGGVIHVFREDFEALEPGTRAAYVRDRTFQELVARLESLLDPDPADPWPRHLEHFGASLGCTCAVYRRAGGMPAVKPLEDVAFVDALRRVGARIRHAVNVEIFTSARLDGRAEIGLSGQLRHWQADCVAGRPHLVDSAEWLAHRFRTLKSLREINRGGLLAADAWPGMWQERIEGCLAQRLPDARFLEVLDCDALIEQTFRGERHGEITVVCERLEGLIAAASA